MKDEYVPDYAELSALNMAVDSALWAKVKAGDQAAKELLRTQADQLVLYDHILTLGSAWDHHEWVSLDKLYEHGIIRSVRLLKDI